MITPSDQQVITTAVIANDHLIDHFNPREVALQIGDKVRVDAGRFAGSIATVQSITSEGIEIKAPSWQIIRTYQRGDLYLMQSTTSEVKPPFNPGDYVTNPAGWRGHVDYYDAATNRVHVTFPGKLKDDYPVNLLKLIQEAPPCR
ncbi:hypothetical protein H6F90_02965 [Trichocoleus sp. FACHB-591]|uniref:hypothetical protein n=1 Tax=Trichocoleus sp. FACHB-591 TaxID=2692872 RepID=UPI0016875174|nr:hypothetical protein [Trichocoleus sp. FACHB-591]MBD2094112.1 hypothetical protein [Trichocoleus sp. FACHB-591]